MVSGNFIHGEYFIDCGSTSEPTARAIFGAWIIVFASVVALCVRSVFRTTVIAELLADNNDNNRLRKPRISVWHVSPATSMTEVLELRVVLARALTRGQLFYVAASLSCVAAALISTASTKIAQLAIASNVVPRTALVHGRLVTSEHTSISGAAVNITARVAALEFAQAPLTQLFDFTPDDASRWIFSPQQWNNTWNGNCTYTKYPAVDLTVFPTNTTLYQDEVPLLGNLLPQWALNANSTIQGTAYSGFYTGAASNGSGAWRDQVVNYVFVSPSDDDATVNVTLVNYLAHHVPRDPTTRYAQASFQSDVYVADCMFNNTTPGIEDQAHPDNRNYANAAGGIASVFQRSIVDTSIADQPVTQPTGQQMVRYWQAYLSVKDAQYPHYVARMLLVQQPVVQIRLSVLTATVTTCILAIFAMAVSKYRVHRDQLGRRLRIPSSKPEWIVQAVCESQRGEIAVCSVARFSEKHDDLNLVIATGPDEAPVARIGWV